MVFNNGTVAGSIQMLLSKPIGGHTEPNSTVGAKLA
jgi:hypothetical protein